MIDYVVHSCGTTFVAVKATLNGREVDATVPGLVVEMISSDGIHGHTFRFVPEGEDDMTQKQVLFTVGNKIRCDFIQIEEPT